MYVCLKGQPFIGRPPILPQIGKRLLYEASVLVSVKKSDPWQPNSIQHPGLLSAVAGSQLTGLTIKCIGRYTGAGTGAGISSADLMLARRWTECSNSDIDVHNTRRRCLLTHSPFRKTPTTVFTHTILNILVSRIFATPAGQ